MDLDLSGKVVLITGGSKGIGYACAEAFAAEGANIALVSRSAGAGLSPNIRRTGSRSFSFPKSCLPIISMISIWNFPTSPRRTGP